MPKSVTLNILLFCALMVCSSPVFATNGYWAHGFGTKSKAMAGAGAAVALEGLDASSNPATLVDVGDRMDFGFSLFSPERGFRANADGDPAHFATIPPGEVESGDELFLIPHFAFTKRLESASAVGIAFGANGGMETEYDSAVFSPFNNPSGTASSPTGIDFKQGYLGLSYSRKISDRHSFGITPVFALQAVRVQGLEPFRAFSASPESLTNNGVDYSYGGGVRIGWLSRLHDRFSVGVSYQTRMKMTKFDKYKGLFAEGGKFDIPPNLTVGVAIGALPNLILVYDLQRIWYGEIRAVGNSADLAFTPGEVLLGIDDGLGFGWQNITVHKFGVQWDWRNDLTLRAGYSISDEAIPGSQALFNILAPAVVTEHYTFGFTKKFGNNELNLAFMYAPEKDSPGMNPNTGPQTGSLYMEQLEMEVSWGWCF